MGANEKKAAALHPYVEPDWRHPNLGQPNTEMEDVARNLAGHRSDRAGAYRNVLRYQAGGNQDGVEEWLDDMAISTQGIAWCEARLDELYRQENERVRAALTTWQAHREAQR